MSDGYNRVMLLGRVGADPELRFTQGGQAVLNVRLAINESYLDKDKVRRESVEWASVVVWNNRGEALAKILTKGTLVFVEGKLKTSSYDNKEGQKVYKTEVVALDVKLCGAKRASGNSESAEDGEGAGHGQQTSGYGYAPAGDGSTGGASRGGATSAGDFEVAFGRDKGKRISEVGDLSWLRGTLERDLADSSKERFHEKARGQLVAIDAELARRAGGGAVNAASASGGGGYAPRGGGGAAPRGRPAPQEAPPPAEDYDAGGGFRDDSDIPF